MRASLYAETRSKHQMFYFASTYSRPELGRLFFYYHSGLHNSAETQQTKCGILSSLKFPEYSHVFPGHKI